MKCMNTTCKSLSSHTPQSTNTWLTTKVLSIANFWLTPQNVVTLQTFFFLKGQFLSRQNKPVESYFLNISLINVTKGKRKVFDFS